MTYNFIDVPFEDKICLIDGAHEKPEKIRFLFHQTYPLLIDILSPNSNLMNKIQLL